MDNAFGRVIDRRSRAGYAVEPTAIAWNAVAFRVRGSRDAIACVPRAELDAFLDGLDAGRLDQEILDFLGTEPSGRVLRAAGQTRRTGLFDELATPDAIVPPERIPRRGIGDHGGGTPSVARRDKRSRGPRPRRLLLAGAAAATVVIVAGVIVVASRGDDKPQPVAVGQTTSTTTTTVPATTSTTISAVKPCESESRNVVTDCSFESPTAPTGSFLGVGPGEKLENWTVGGSVDLVNKDFAGGYPVKSGVQSLDLNHNDVGSIAQDVPTTAASTYVLTFSLSGYPAAPAGCSATEPQEVTVVAGATTKTFSFQPDDAANPPGAQRFETHSFTFTGNPGATSTPVEFDGTNRGCAGGVIDDVSVVPQ